MNGTHDLDGFRGKSYVHIPKLSSKDWKYFC